MKSCALHTKPSGGTCGATDGPVRILGKRENKDPELQKASLKLVGEEPTSVMPNEIEMLVKELPCDSSHLAFPKEQRRMYDCKTPQFQHMIPNSFEIAIIIAY